MGCVKFSQVGPGRVAVGVMPLPRGDPGKLLRHLLLFFGTLCGFLSAPLPLFRCSLSPALPSLSRLLRIPEDPVVVEDGDDGANQEYTED